jgi:hypothetical protein
MPQMGMDDPASGTAKNIANKKDLQNALVSGCKK